MHNLFGRILGPFFEENCGELYFWKFNLSECHLHNIQIYLSTFKIIHAPNCAKLNDRGLHWSYRGHTLKGLRYERQRSCSGLIQRQGGLTLLILQGIIFTVRRLLVNADSRELQG